ncbi:MAG: TetR/AcrR family transcriptional regulator [Spongiibacteraceae bacterium]
MTPDTDGPEAPLNRQVVDALIDATARLLTEKSRADITVREIAQAAGVNPAMINYYFQNKNGLFLVFIDHLIQRYFEAMKQLESKLEALDPGQDNPTHLIISTVVNVYSENAAGLRLLSSEIQLNSELKDAYSARHASRTTKAFKHILKRLVERGIYRADLDINYTAFTLETLLSQHVINGGVMKAAFDLEPDSATISGWINHLTTIFERGLRA